MEARHPKETRFFCFVMRASTELKGAIIWPWRPDTPNRQGSLVLGLAQAWPQVLIKTWALEPTIFINCWVFSGLLVVSLVVEVGVMDGCWCHWQPPSHVPLQSQCVIPCRQLQRPKNTYPKPLVSSSGEPSLVMRASELKGAMIWPWRPDTPKRQGSFVLL